MQEKNVQIARITPGQDHIFQAMSDKTPMTKKDIRAKLLADSPPSSSQMQALINAGLIKISGSRPIKTWNGKASNSFVHANTYLKIRKPYQVVLIRGGKVRILAERTGNE